VLTASLPCASDFTNCAFSGDNKFLVTAVGSGGGGECMVVVWRWFNEVAVAISRCSAADITRVRFVPRDSSLITVSGPKYLRMWRCSADTLKEMPMVPPKYESEVR
jgi:hypothetical protein